MKLKYHLVLCVGLLFLLTSKTAWATEPETKNEKAIATEKNKESEKKQFLLSSTNKKSHIIALDDEKGAARKSSDGEGDPPSSNQNEPADELSPESIEALDKTVEQYGLYIDLLNPNKGFDLPMGVRKSVGGENGQDGKEVSIIIQDMEFTPNGAKMNVCMSADIPLGENKSISFRGRNIAFNPGGISGEGTLELASNLKAFDILDGKASFNIIGKRGKTYVNFDCNGYAGMGIDTEIEFRDLLVPAPYSANSTSTVKTGLALSFGKDEFFDDIIAEINLDPFTIDKPGIRDFSFSLTDAIIDLSDKRNTEPFNFPSGYSNGFASNPKLWTGFYAKNITVTIPKRYSLEGNNAHTFSASDLYIDNTGVTGTFTGTGIIPLKEDKEGWQMSLDELSIALLQNEFKSIRTKGVVKLPIQAKNEKLGLAYNGMVASNGDYSISAALTSTLTIKFPAFHSKLNIYKGSDVYLKEIDNKTNLGANLNGELAIDFNVTNNFKIENIGFKGLCIQNKKPYFDIESIYGGVSCQFENFPVNDLGLAFKKENDLFGLGLGATINFTGGENGFGAGIGLTYFTEVKKVDNKLSFNFKELKIDSISIDVNTGAFSLDGGLIAYQKDQTYGTGFMGRLKMSMQPGFFVDVSGQFGKITNTTNPKLSYRYFYADALGALPPPGIPIFSGASIYGFGGGISYHMNKTGDIEAVTEESKNKSTPLNPGISNSGMKFTPDNNIGLGFSASVIIGCQGNPTPYNGLLTFGMQFTTSWGVDKLWFDGKTYFMNDLYSAPGDPKMYGKANITMEFTEPKLIGNFDINIDNKPSYHAVGKADFLLSDEKWHVNVGKPDMEQRFDFYLNNGAYHSRSYFLMGNDNIGTIPAPPSDVIDIKDNKYSDKSITDGSKQRSDADLDSLQHGKGIAFGAFIRKGIIEKQKYLIFEGSFDRVIGGDFLLRYVDNYKCAETNLTPGINGWFAEAQAYAALTANLGINVKVFNRPVKETIFNATLAALLQAKGPNPFYATGHIQASYNVMSGLVKGNCDFQVELGQKCTLVDATLNNIKIISDVAPKETAGNVSVFTKPQVTFNIKIGRIYTGYLEGVETQYKVELDKFYISKKGSDTPIPGELIWNDERTTVAIKTNMVLPALSDLQGYVKTTLKQKTGSGYIELPGGSSEDTIFFFATDAEPDTIPHSNVAFSYPIIDQYNFYKDLHPHGYIKLVQGQNEVFKLEKGWTTEGRMKSRQTGAIKTFNYKSNRRDSIYFDLPTLDANTIYDFTLVKIPPRAEAVDSNVKLDSIQRKINTSSDVKITTKSLDGNISEGKEKIIYKALFRTSKFKTFDQKISSMTKSNRNFVRFQHDGIQLLRMDLTTEEAFDKFELFGEGNQPELIEVFAQPKDSLNDWYAMIIDEGYKLLGDQFLNVQKPFRYDYESLGKTHNIYPHYAVKLITDNVDAYDLKTRNYINAPLNQTLLISYDVEKYAYKDCGWIFGRVNFPFIYDENRDDEIVHKNIKVKFRYYLPGVDDVYYEADKVLLIGNM